MYGADAQQVIRWLGNARMNLLVVTNPYPPQERRARPVYADFVWGLRTEAPHSVLSSNAPHLGTNRPGPSGETVDRDLTKGSWRRWCSAVARPSIPAIDRSNAALIRSGSTASRGRNCWQSRLARPVSAPLEARYRATSRGFCTAPFRLLPAVLVEKGR